MKVVMATLLLVSLLLSSSFLAIANAHYSSICDSKCEVRCSKAGEKKRCLKYCGICCEECKYCAPSRTNKNKWECKYCVPSGTYGNKWECPCYQKKLNSKGYPKCP